MSDIGPVASLPMYDWPELAWATDSLWRAIAERLKVAGIRAPDTLDRVGQVEDVWRDPGLVLSQTCGFPYATRLRNAVCLVATPVYDVQGCEGPLYSSLIVARCDERGRGLTDFAGRRVAFSAPDSLSGYVALASAARGEGMALDSFDWLETGSHRASIRAVADGSVDLAAIDAVCWALAARFEAEAVSRLAAIARTPLRPALPFITAAGRSKSEVDAIRAALADVLASPETERARAALCLTGVAVLTPARYEPLAKLAH